MSVPYKKQYTNLLRQMDPSSVRGFCFSEDLLSLPQKNALFAIQSDMERHNITLLTILERLPKNFLVFRDKILPKEENNGYKDIIEGLRKFKCKCF